MRLLLTILGAAAGVILLVSVRVFEEQLFYDPLNTFYHGDFHKNPFPQIEFGKYAFNLILRLLFNTSISLAIIYVLFRNPKHIKLSAIVFCVIGGFLLIMLLAQLGIQDDASKQAVFYTRRMLIHPILLFILTPALYFQDLASKNKQ